MNQSTAAMNTCFLRLSGQGVLKFWEGLSRGSGTDPGLMGTGRWAGVSPLEWNKKAEETAKTEDCSSPRNLEKKGRKKKR
jgi:hypothetical protein